MPFVLFEYDIVINVSKFHSNKWSGRQFHNLLYWPNMGIYYQYRCEKNNLPDENTV